MRCVLVAALFALAAPAAAQEHERIPDGTVRFRSGSYDLTPDSKRDVDRILEFVRKHEQGDVLVVGHTDRHGGAATNRKLSLNRAKRVRAALIERGIDAKRLSVIGVGFAEPLSKERGDAADQLNRRAELWIGTNRAIAWVSWIHIVVQAQKPIAPTWFPAEIQMPLRRLFRVRTVGRSAGEVTFRNGDTIYLGPSALAIIYGQETRQNRKKKLATADVTIDGGGLLARLKRRTQPRVFETTDARITVASKSTRIFHDKPRKQTTVSVYDGHADVEAKGASVRVRKGYGTRVRRGLRPDKPTPLVKPPKWKSAASRFALEGEAFELAWITDVGSSSVSLEVAHADDAQFARALRTSRTAATSTTVKLSAGRFHARLVSISDTGIVGQASDPLPLMVAPRPKSSGPALDGRRVEIIGHGVVAIPSSPGMTITPTVARFDRPGTFKLPLSVAVKGAKGTIDLEVIVHRVTLAARDISVAATSTTSAIARATIDISHDVPVKLVPSMGALRRDGGAHVLEYQHAPTETATVARVTVRDDARYVAPFIVELPLATRLSASEIADEPEPKDEADVDLSWRGFADARLGASIAAVRDAAPTVAFGGGATRQWGSGVGVSLGATLGYMPSSPKLTRTLRGDAHVLSLLGRASLDWHIGHGRLYAGGGGGARLVLGDASVEADAIQLAWLVGLGLAADIGDGEAFIEGNWGPLGVAGNTRDALLGVPEVMVGFRWLP